jgi:aminopeptidase N
VLPAGQKDSVSIYYRGIPPDSGSGAFTKTTHNNVPVLWTLSQPYGARTWWPCKDALTDKADSIDIVLTYPAAYRSSSNGLPVQELRIGDKKQDYWKHRYPIATYLVAFAITDYELDYDEVQLPSRKMPVLMYAYPEDAVAFQQATNAAKAGLIKFSELLGEYPFSRERYAQTQFGRGGGMEHQTNSFIASPHAWLVAHELAHQWFGDKVTNGSWQDLWLNEGFATYMELVYDEMVVNNTLPLYLLKNWRDRITDAPGGAVFITDTTNIRRLFDYRLTYLKGGYVLHMLRWRLGDSAFFQVCETTSTTQLYDIKQPEQPICNAIWKKQAGRILLVFFLTGFMVRAIQITGPYGAVPALQPYGWCYPKPHLIIMYRFTTCLCPYNLKVGGGIRSLQ